MELTGRQGWGGLAQEMGETLGQGGGERNDQAPLWGNPFLDLKRPFPPGPRTGPALRQSCG